MVRSHRADRGPWWFGSGGHGRFDLAPDPERPQGTCYLAAEPLGAFVEVFRHTALVDQADVARRRWSRLAVPRSLRLADCTARNARAYGITGAIHSTPDYRLTNAWAAAFAEAGFDGVRYLVSHDPAQRLVGYALFGPAGAGGPPEWPDGEVHRLDDDLLRRAREELGILVVPRF
jgi:hypothetical protein